jgi:hypothetical protein
MMQNSDEPSADLFECIVVALPLGAGVFGSGFLAQGVQDGLRCGGAARREVAVEPPGPAQGGLEADQTRMPSMARELLSDLASGRGRC